MTWDELGNSGYNIASNGRWSILCKLTIATTNKLVEDPSNKISTGINDMPASRAAIPSHDFRRKNNAYLANASIPLNVQSIAIISLWWPRLAELW